jgi:hypothetical protein
VTRRRRAAVPVVLGLALAAVLGPGVASSRPAAAASIATPVPEPLATSIHTAAGTWATLPMGRLNQPLNTFWQLFFQPAGTTSWSDQVRATATATNGGLVLASAAGRPFIAAVRPANLLRFSPIIATTDAGHSWSNGLLSDGLAASPSALFTAPDGQTLALVDKGLRGRVLASGGNLSAWHTLLTARQLAGSGPGAACHLQSLTAVAALSGRAVIGASCGRPGAVGLFDQRAGSWQTEPLELPASLRRGRVQVLTLAATASGLSAVLRVATPAGAVLVAAWATPSGQWTVSPAAPLPPNRHLVSIGPADGIGLFALSATASGSTALTEVDGPGAAWRTITPPPRGTATVAFDPASPAGVTALAVRGTTMTAWTLAAGRWDKGQVLRISLKFGSSS